MKKLLKLSQAIDALNEWVGKCAIWLVLAAVSISTINALVRKLNNTSSNAYLEIQWYLFSGIFLLGAGYTMLKQGHVRIDVISGRFSKRTQTMIEMFGIAVFLMPFVYAIITEIWPLVVNAWVHNEMSENASGLPRFWVYVLVPIGFALLGLQGVSEFIKRLGFLLGVCADPTHIPDVKTAEEELAEEIKKNATI